MATTQSPIPPREPTEQVQTLLEAQTVATPYDNDVTLLYKRANVVQMPLRLMVVRPRTPEDANIPHGTNAYVFESLQEIVYRLAVQGESLSSIYDIINHYNALISIDDIVMVYYAIISQDDPDADYHTFINQAYRDISDLVTIDKFENQAELRIMHDTWLTDISNERAESIRRLEIINGIEHELDKVNAEEKLPFSPVTISSAIMSFSPTLNGRRVTPEDGLDIFDNAIPSKYVPYIRFNDKFGRAMSRVYTGGKIEDEPNYGVTIIPASDATAKNTIYMTLWLGDDKHTLQTAPRESFYIVIYHLDTNYLTVESPIGAEAKKGLIRDETVAFERTRSALQGLDFGTGKEIKVRGEFNIWNATFDETSFIDMILIDPVMNVYLYIEENIKPFALKKRLDVHYRSIFSDLTEGKTTTDEAYISNSASVSVTLTKKISEAGEVVDVFDTATKEVTQAMLPPGSEYIHVTISQAESRAVLDNFIPIFQLLMRYYLDESQEVLVPYLTYLPELAQLDILLAQRKHKPEPQAKTILALTKKTAVTKRGDAKINRLREQMPDLFVDAYARECQCGLQPIIVSLEEAEAWKQRRVGPALEERQVMPFPRTNPRVMFVCPNDDAPYPGLKYNRKLANSEIYPYIPCCYATDQMTPRAEGDALTKYQRYVRGEPVPPKRGAKAMKKIVTRKILSPNKVAVLPRAVENIIKAYSDEAVDIVRYGVLYSPNSLLHCIAVAIDDPNYIRLTTDEQREAYVLRIRQHMLATILPAMYKQEMYDYADQEITALLADGSKFLDPSLFYRGVEDIFNINIYTFSQPVGDTDLGSIDIPRFKIFHSRPKRSYRPTVVIIKNAGSESDALEYPQCELIADYDKDTETIIKLFGPNMTDVCHEALEEVMKTISWSLRANAFDARANLYYHIDHLRLFGMRAVSQFIDNNGKMRALTLDIGNNQTMTVATIPSQPENLPSVEGMIPVSIQTATTIFGEPTSVSRNAKGLVNGLWFRIMDIPNGEYVSVIPGKGFDAKPLGPPNPIISDGTAVTHRITRMRRTLAIITQVVKWLFNLARTKKNIDPAGFADAYMAVDQDAVPDSSTYYDITRVPRRLPIAETIEDAIRILEPVVPTLFYGGRIVMYNTTFLDRIVKMLRDYSILHMGLAIPRITFIENYYETEADFRRVVNSKTFITDRDLSAWLDSLKGSQYHTKYFNIRRNIEVAMGFTTDPFIYQDEDGRIYIIQNVVGGSKLKALAVAKTWIEHHVNVGADPALQDIADLQENVPVHMLYGISPSAVLIPIEDQTLNSPVFLRLVYYGSHIDKAVGKEARYGAMLEIL